MTVNSREFLELGVDLEVHLDDRLLPVLLAPVAGSVDVAHDFPLLVDSIHFLHIQVVQLHQVLLDFGLAEEIVHAEANDVLPVILRGAHHLQLMVDELDLGLRLREVAGDRGFVPLGVHVPLEV